MKDRIMQLLLFAAMTAMVGGIAQPLTAAVRLAPVSDGVCRELNSGRMWQVVSSKKLRSLDQAQAYVEQLDLGGYDDWRLPTVAELFELTMMHDLHETGGCAMVVEGNYWSGDRDAQGRAGAWELDDNCDAERQYIPKQTGVVRAVRN